MALPDKHPEYVEQLGNWIQMADTYAGERAVKTKRLDYLPATEGMVQDGMTTPMAPGWKDYEAYLLRAVYHNFVRDAVQAMVGILHNKPAVITLPPRLKDMMEKATIQGETLQQLLRRINVAQLKFGRCALLVDVPTGEDVNKALPYIAFYEPLRIINWDAGRENEGRNQLQLVVIDESGYRREGFTWKEERKFRVLTRGIPDSLESGWETPGPDEEYSVAVKVNDSSMPIAADFKTPEIGGVTLKDIPFVFIGANDLVPEPEVPPLLNLSNLSLAIYRAEADYRQTLYLQGQQTLVVIGIEGGGAEDEDAPLRTGAKGMIGLRQGSDAKYIGVSASGLGEMRQSLTTDKTAAASEGISFLDVGNARGESGEALRIRVAARTTTISSVAQAAGAGLERALKYAAEWVGDNPDDVSVEVPKDFADQTVQGAALLAFMQAKQLGLPLSLKSIHGMMKANDMSDLTFDEENDQIEAEAETMLGGMVSPYQMNPVDDNFLDGDNPPDLDSAGPGGGGGGATPPTPGQPPAGPAPVAPPAQNVPVTPHVRGSPTPLKKRVGPKGASAGKGGKGK
jgi:hypothetical protein